MIFTRIVSIPTLISSILLLEGCMAVALAPGVGLVTGVMDNEVTVSIDEQSISPEVRAAFNSAKKIAVVAGDRASVKAADLFESAGGYLVSIDRPTAKNGEMTGSERRDALKRLCVGAQHPDISLLGRTTQTESNNTAVAALTGRIKQKESLAIEIQVCTTGTIYTLSGSIEIDAGMYNVKPQELEEKIGAVMGTTLIAALGRKQSTSQTLSQPRHNSTEVQAVAEPRSQLPALVTESRTQSITAMDAQKRLIELGFLVGKADGIVGRQTIDALRKFQAKAGVTVTGRIVSATVAALMSSSKGN